MCGFVGCTNTERAFVAHSLRRLAHRGPDEQKVVTTPLGTLGHARLSIVDVEGSHQPMNDGLSWIVFNGEIYNYSQLRSILPGPWTTHGDTEVVLKLLAEDSTEAVEKLDGMFALAIVDRHGLTLARDPIGIKPLYYVQACSGTYFASEIKALLDLPGKIREFPAGHWWKADRGFVRYFDLGQLQRERSHRRGFPARVKKDLRTVLRRAVHKRLIADPGVPVGVSLSGGLDSSLIAALARQGRSKLDTFVVGMESSEDVARSRQVAAALGTSHHVYIYTFEEMLEILPRVIYHLESFDAALVRSAIPNYFLARLAAETVRVILTGEGADELFGGYAYLRDVSDPQAFQRELLTITGSLHNTNLQRTDRMTMAHGIEGRVPFLDREMVRLALSLPPQLKFHGRGRPEKAILRQAFSGLLPEDVLQRPKQKFSQGAGSMDRMAEHARRTISDEDFQRACAAYPEARLQSKEELLYFRIFQEQFGGRVHPSAVGRTRSVTPLELC